MTNISIVDLNFTKKQGFWWLIILGCIPIFNILSTLFILIYYLVVTSRVMLRQVPFFVAFKRKNIGKISYFGYFFLFLTVACIVFIMFFPEIIFTVIRPVRLWIIYAVFALPLFVTAMALFIYSIHYKEYIEFVNNFLNNIMIRHQRAESFDTPVFLNAAVDDPITTFMLEDLEKNNIIRLEDDTESFRKAIYFTGDFQKVLMKKTSNEHK